MFHLMLNFNSIMGYVRSDTVVNSLLIMLKGMVSIFLVMSIIYAVIWSLSKIFSKTDNKPNM